MKKTNDLTRALLPFRPCFFQASESDASPERIVAAYENMRFTASTVFSTSASPPSGPQKLEADLLL